MRTSSGVTSSISLKTADGVILAAVHIPARHPTEIAIVLVPGFSGWSQAPGVARASAVLAEFAEVLQVDLRGHGRSGGTSTLADREVLDVDAAVAYARTLGFPHVITVGFSMGGAAVMRHGGLVGEEIYGYPLQHPSDALVCVSTGSVWYQRDTRPMRRLHWLVLTRLGRVVARHAFHVRIDPAGWGAEPISPLDAAARLSVPLLLVQGDQDSYVRAEHGYSLSEAASGPVEFWMEHGFGHAEEAAEPALLRKIGAALPGLLTMTRPPKGT
jgi:pimeloyl-ACP methyl ester carboxylesterase